MIYIHLKLFIVASIILNSTSVLSQSDVADFINQKIKSDSLWSLNFCSKTVYIDTGDVCFHLNYLLEDKISLALFTDTIFQNEIKDTSISTDDFFESFDRSEKRALQEQRQYVYWDSMCIENSEYILNQKKIASKTKRHRIKEITATEKVITHPKKRAMPFFSFSRPIFLNQKKKIAVILVNVIWGKLYGRGYFEVYEKNKNNIWSRKAQILIWMS